ILMTLAWMVFIPTAILFARYCRGQWPNRTPFGIQIWFHVHRTCNLLGVAMTIAACKYFVFSLPYFAFSCLHFHSEGRVLERTSGVRFGPK
ncbi:Protein C13B4.1 a, partial [Aphelenchoides avenae]